jgi:hypothetical protein
MLGIAALLESNILLITIVVFTTVGLTIASWVLTAGTSPSPKIHGHGSASGHGHRGNHHDSYGHAPAHDLENTPEDWGGDGRVGEDKLGSHPVHIQINLDEVVDRLSRIEALVAPTWNKRLTDLAKNLFFAFLGLFLSVFVGPMFV